MPLIRCPHCGEDTFTIAGWAHLDYCASCGRSLAGREPELDLARDAKRRLPRSRRSVPDGRPPGERASAAATASSAAPAVDAGGGGASNHGHHPKEE